MGALIFLWLWFQVYRQVSHKLRSKNLGMRQEARSGFRCDLDNTISSSAFFRKEGSLFLFILFQLSCRNWHTYSDFWTKSPGTCPPTLSRSQPSVDIPKQAPRPPLSRGGGGGKGAVASCVESKTRSPFSPLETLAFNQRKSLLRPLKKAVSKWGTELNEEDAGLIFFF